MAAAAWPVDWHDDWSSYAAKLTAWVEQAASGGAELLVFPEYATMELASVFGVGVAADLGLQIGRVAELADEIDDLHARLAARTGIHIVAATLALPLPDGRVVNRSRFFGPDGLLGHQDKLVMTRFEREQWNVQAGSGQRVFDTPLGRIGIAVCYDVEFPLVVRRLVEAGADLVAVPTCTDTEAGFWRVKIGAMARALESQFVTVTAPTVGLAPWSPALDENRGAAGIYGPPDRGWPANGILAEGAMDAPGWTFADVDLERVREVRANGQVLNHRHWDEQ